jgi:hypothetical protein
MNNKTRTTMGWTSDSKQRGFSQTKLKDGNSRLLRILTTKPSPDTKQHIYKRLDEWPGLRPFNMTRLKGFNQSTKSIGRISTYEKPI